MTWLMKQTLRAGFRALAPNLTYDCQLLGKLFNSLSLSFLMCKIVSITVAFSWEFYMCFTLSSCHNA